MHSLSIRTTLTWIYNRLIPALLLVLALIGLWFISQRAERYIYNAFIRWSAQPAVSSPVRLILIDDDSLTRLQGRFGPPPWPRKVYLEIFQRIHAAKPAVMVFDSHFVSLSQADDIRFFTELKQFPNLIGGLVVDEAGSEPSWMNSQLPQYYRLNLGVVSVSEDDDAIIRSVKPVYQLRTGLAQMGVFPSLSLAAVYEYLSQRQPGQNWAVNIEKTTRQPVLALYSEQNPEQGIRLPLNQEGNFYIRWYRLQNQGKAEYARSHQAIPLWKFFEVQPPVSELEGKIALIGSSSIFHRDYHQSPLDTRHLGPDIHATAIDNILQGQAVQKVGFLLNLMIVVVLFLMTFFLRFRIGNIGKTLLYTLGLMIIYCWTAFWVLAKQSFWLDVITPEAFMLVAFLAGSTCRIFFKEKQLAAMERSLSQLVDPEVFQEVRRLSHVLKPGGERLEITSMFVDIRNFTALAERLQPAEVTELLNEFYGDIVSIVFSYHGTIDKFMGDGILMIFGAPLPNENHRSMALQAANDILEATGKLSRHWQETKGIDTDIGISLNSGMAFVGFLGPTDKLEYTGVGDTVNICVRLQEHTKQFRTRLIMSENTVNGLQGQLAEQIPPEVYVPLGEVVVRGREATIRIFTLKQAFLDH